jgi:tRNA threonylcarbamoyladenosine biosynthesis protein TsaE
MVFRSNSEAETEALGGRLAQVLKPGSVVAFTGDLGAGKTAFVRGLARGLGITQRVTSPTYTIANEYEGGRLPLFHFDLYRLSGEDELYEIGWEDYLARGGVCALEWSERAPGLLEETCIRVDIRRGPGEGQREITVEGAEL